MMFSLEKAFFKSAITLQHPNGIFYRTQASDLPTVCVDSGEKSISFSKLRRGSRAAKNKGVEKNYGHRANCMMVDESHSRDCSAEKGRR